MKILAIAPHPDDEVLGCGGTLLKYSKEGDEIYLCVATKAYAPDWPEEFLKNRPKEIEKAGRILNIKKTYFLDFHTVKLDTVPQKELIGRLSDCINEIKPDMLYIPHRGDLHKDHRLIFEACLVAARPLNHRIKSILSYETLSETGWGQAIEPFVPNVYVDVSEFFGKKIEAMKAYGSELRQFPHPRSLEAIEALAKKRGSEAGAMFAEAFVLIREIRE